MPTLVDRHMNLGQSLLDDFITTQLSDSLVVINADCFEWMSRAPENLVHAIVTDPPYGVKEYEPEQLAKKENGTGGIWRIPPSFDGSTRSPLPRFTALNERELDSLSAYYVRWAGLCLRILRPGGHLFVASNTFLSQLIYQALTEGGLEFRGELIRLVRTLRGGDRPKNAEVEFSDVSTLPRGCYEPWGLFRKPLPAKMTVAECLRTYETGGLRRRLDGNPINDVLPSERTPHRERAVAPHPSLKPQSFMRQIVYSALPLGKGILLDPFMGSGSTLAAAKAVGYAAVGIERSTDYYAMSLEAIPRLAALADAGTTHQQLTLPLE